MDAAVILKSGIKIKNRVIKSEGGTMRDEYVVKRWLLVLIFLASFSINAGQTTTDVWLTNNTGKKMLVYLGFCIVPSAEKQQLPTSQRQSLAQASQKLAKEVLPGERLMVHQVSRVSRFFPPPRACSLILVPDGQQILFVIDEKARGARVGEGEWNTGWGPYHARIGLYRVDYCAVLRDLYADYEIRVTQEIYPGPAAARR